MRQWIVDGPSGKRFRLISCKSFRIIDRRAGSVNSCSFGFSGENSKVFRVSLLSESGESEQLVTVYLSSPGS